MNTPMHSSDTEPQLSSKADPQTLLLALTTEHSTLQSARASTVSESTSRASLFVSALSSSLIALGFLGQMDKAGLSFHLFALVVLPTLYVLGTFTFVRLVQSTIEDLWYGKAINRIRHYYLEIAGQEANRFAMGAHDDTLGVLANMGMQKPSRWQLYFTLASMIAVLNAIVGGSSAALLASTLGGSLALTLGIGAIVGMGSAYLSFHWQRSLHTHSRGKTKALFPSPRP